MPNKISCEELAIFGGKQSFKSPLHVNLPNVGNRKTFDMYVDEIWDRKWFTNNGPLATKLEQTLQQFLGVRHCILMSSGTSALSVLIRALGLSGEVILPSFTFVSTAHSLQWSGITPIFCDIDPSTWNMDCEHCETLISDRTTAIIATHLWGRPCEIERLQELADRKRIRLIYDSAHAFGCTYQDKFIGNFGDAEVFSFQANKVFQTIEGGAVTCNDDTLAEQLRAMRNFGFTGLDNVEYVGTNAKLPETSAAMGLTNFEAFDSFVKKSKSNYHLYLDCLSESDGMSVQLYDETQKNNYQYIVLKLSQQCGVARDDLVEILRGENILARRYFYPGCHRMKPYASLFQDADRKLTNTNDIAESVFVLPSGTGVSHEQIREICGILLFIMENTESINSKLGNQRMGLQESEQYPLRRAA